MGCELRDEFWGMSLSFSMERFLFICCLRETVWQWWLGGCVCVLVKVPFFTELWTGTTNSLNFVYHDFVNLVHLTDLTKLHLGIPNSLVWECSRKECNKSSPVFPYFMFFLQRCQGACFTFERTLHVVSSVPTFAMYLFFWFYTSSVA